MQIILTTIFERLALAILTLLIVSVLIFSSVALLPGDFAKAVLGQSVDCHRELTLYVRCSKLSFGSSCQS